MIRAALMMSSSETLPLCHYRHSSLSVLDLQLNSHLEALPVAGSFGNVVTNLLGRQAKGTDLRSEGGCGSNLSTHSPHVDIFHLIRVKLGSHDGFLGGSLNSKCKKFRYVLTTRV